MRERDLVLAILRGLAMWAIAVASWGMLFAAEADEGEAAKPKEPKVFKVELRASGHVVGIDRKGDAGLGECFEVRRGGRLVGYAQVVAMDKAWPRLGYLLGAGRKDDELVPVSLRVPESQLLIDDQTARIAKELKALLGDRIFIEELGEKTVIHDQCTVRLVIIHGGVFFMMGDSIAAPFASAGGTVIIDALAYSHLKGAVADEKTFEEPPTMRIVESVPLTAGIASESRIPWYGTKGKKFVARYYEGLPKKDGEKMIATDHSTENSAIIDVDLGGRMLMLDLITPNGRAGRDPGSKNKLLFVARALGTGPLFARYMPRRPEYDDLMTWFDGVVENNKERLTKAFEGGADKREDFIYGFTIGEKDKPLVALVAGLDGTEWLGATALLRLAEVLLDNPGGDYKIPWLLERLRVKILPVVNVAGFRKNAALTENGCELQRNFAYHWEESPDKKARGRQPFSEAGAAVVQRLVEEEKAVGILEIGVDDYDAGYRIVRGRDATDAQRRLLHALGTVANARLLRRFVVDGEKMLQLRLTKDRERPSLVNWAASKGALAASLRICGDGEDSLTNNDVAIETCLQFLYTVALSLEKPEPPPAEEAPKKPAKRPAGKRSK